jgi:BirA family biotin operon repressor/biotin-[acetyl-CoA-carboxylase] ligase
MSRALGISRAAIWKHVVALREAGFTVEAIPSRGYRLRAAPDLLLPSEIQRGLATTFVGRDIHHFESVDSTNRVALALADEGAAEARASSRRARARGADVRPVLAPPRVNLHTSVILRLLPMVEAAQVVLVGLSRRSGPSTRLRRPSGDAPPDQVAQRHPDRWA